MSKTLTVLPVLSWEDSAERFQSIHPNAGEYLLPHHHKHKECGHVLPCPWPRREYPFGPEDQAEAGLPPSDQTPCQAYEHWDAKCWDCY
jgi:hypothetical protein